MLSAVKILIFWKVNDTTSVQLLRGIWEVAIFTVDKNLMKTNVSHICRVITLSKVTHFQRLKLSKVNAFKG
jgi:hypothetical protein